MGLPSSFTRLLRQGSSAEIVDNSALKYLNRDDLKDKAYKTWVHGPLEVPSLHQYFRQSSVEDGILTTLELPALPPYCYAPVTFEVPLQTY